MTLEQNGQRSKADGPGESLVDEPTAEALETPEQSADRTEWEKAADGKDGPSGKTDDPGDEDEDEGETGGAADETDSPDEGEAGGTAAN